MLAPSSVCIDDARRVFAYWSGYHDPCTSPTAPAGNGHAHIEVHSDQGDHLTTLHMEELLHTAIPFRRHHLAVDARGRLFIGTIYGSSIFMYDVA